ncbi:MAG TPA: tetratricopeptide repeat protein, partial [Polyangiaceae bacterium]|nr:tetratricopeptide repeat protein [Polyangiaceae bacterium]
MAINRDKILQEAQKLVDKKRYDKAIAEYQKVVADDPTDVRTQLKIGNLYLQLEQFAEAISTYERVGAYYSQQGFAVKAVAVYKQIREIIQKHAPHLEDRFGHVVPKLAELLTQLDLRSDALTYYDEMATRLQRVGRDRDAIDVFRKIVGLDPENPVPHLRLADALTRVRDFDGAVAEYTLAAEILVRIGRLDDALRVVERLLQHRSEGRYARMAAAMYLDRGQPPDTMAALTKLQIAVKENPRDLDTLWLLGRAFDQLGQPQKAVEVHKEAARIAREVQNREAFDRLIGLLLQRAPNDEAVRQLVASANEPFGASVPPSSLAPSPAVREPAPTRPRDEVSEIEVIDDDLEVIDDDVEQPIPLRASYPPEESDPANVARQAMSAAETARRTGNYPVAIRVLRTAVEANPAARELRERLCDVLIESGDQESAVVEMLQFATYLVSEDDQDAAARLLDEVLLLDPENRDALELLNALGYAVPTAELEEEEPPPPAARPAPPPPVEPPPSTVTYSRAGHPNYPSYDPLAPLPSYDLEELTANELPLPPSQKGLPAPV